MIRPCICVLVGVALTIAAGSVTPAPGAQDEEAKSKAQPPAPVPAPHPPAPGAQKEGVESKAQPPAPVFSPHGIPSRTLVEGKEARSLQPWRVEYSYPLNSDAERRKSVTGLQQLTVDLLALHNMYKEAHWDLTGPLFLPLHDYFQRQADFYLRQADTFAERVLQLGARVDGRFSTIASTTRLADLPDGYLTDDHALKLMLDRVTVFQKEIYELIRETGDGDPPTSKKLQGTCGSCGPTCRSRARDGEISPGSRIRCPILRATERCLPRSRPGRPGPFPSEAPPARRAGPPRNDKVIRITPASDRPQPIRFRSPP
jgi:DNA-binding ferritin-like protein